MKCDMPGCCNESIKTLKLHGIHAGIAQKVEVHFCNFHGVREIDKRIEEIYDTRVTELQSVNPFKDVKIHSKS